MWLAETRMLLQSECSSFELKKKSRTSHGTPEFTAFSINATVQETQHVGLPTWILTHPAGLWMRVGLKKDVRPPDHQMKWPDLQAPLKIIQLTFIPNGKGRNKNEKEIFKLRQAEGERRPFSRGFPNHDRPSPCSSSVETHDKTCNPSSERLTRDNQPG